MNYATLTFNKKMCIYFVDKKLKVLKLKEGICNARLIQELECVW